MKGKLLGLAAAALVGISSLAYGNDKAKDYQNEVNLSFGVGVNASKEGASFVMKPQVNIDFPYGNFSVGADIYPAEGMGNTAAQPYVTLGANVEVSNSLEVNPFVGAKGFALGIGSDYAGSYVCQKPQAILGFRATLDDLFTGEISTSISESGIESATFSVGLK